MSQLSELSGVDSFIAAPFKESPLTARKQNVNTAELPAAITNGPHKIVKCLFY